MPITLNTVTGTLDAEVVDDNFGELENLLKENLTNSDFKDKFDKYKIRRYTSGRIASFNSGSNMYGSARTTALSGTFENNWVSGTPAITYVDQGGAALTAIATGDGKTLSEDTVVNDMGYNHPLLHPFELLGYPGGSLYYDFQEQGFADPVSYYSNYGYGSVSNWPPGSSPLNRFPSDECWSRWLTVPDAAGGIYVDEPCVALITAQVQGNYFFTPALRVHGTNTSLDGLPFGVGVDMVNPGGATTTNIDVYGLYPAWKLENPNLVGYPIGGAGCMSEGMQHSAAIRLGLFVDTNPIVWDDEFQNGNDYGHSSLGSGHGFNPWIGSNPDGEYASTRPDGVSKTRSWVKVTDLSCRVRQRGSYKIIGAVELKGRRRYNFSMKFRPSMTFGHVVGSAAGGGGGYAFKSDYYELNSSFMPEPSGTEAGFSYPNHHNPGWFWGHNGPIITGGTPSATGQSWQHSYFFPGHDALVTNMIDSSSISVEFFYGQRLSNLQVSASNFTPGWDPTGV